MQENMKVQIVRRSRVTGGEKEEMFSLFRHYFVNLELDVFLRDLEEKNWVIMMRTGANRIFGFSTIRVLEKEVGGRRVVYVFSGDTIVERDYWQYNMLAPAFGFFMLRMIEEFPGTPVYWFLISKGYRTYRFLPTYFNRFYPCYFEETPQEYDVLLKFICREKFGQNYDPEKGIISFKGAREHLNDEMCEVPESRRNNPHVKYFLERNPHFQRGDELACIADISRENLNRKAYRIMENRSVEWLE